jgi:non-ribosomal peptide synthetase component F
MLNQLEYMAKDWRENLTRTNRIESLTEGPWRQISGSRAVSYRSSYVTVVF